MKKFSFKLKFIALGDLKLEIRTKFKLKNHYYMSHYYFNSPFIKDTIISFHYYFIFTMKCDNYYLSTIISNINIRSTIIWCSAIW